MMKNSKGTVTLLRRLLLLSGLAFAVGMSGCGSDADNGAANKPEATEAPEDAGANDETAPSGGDGLDGFFTFTDDKFYLTGLGVADLHMGGCEICERHSGGGYYRRAWY